MQRGRPQIFDKNYTTLYGRDIWYSGPWNEGNEGTADLTGCAHSCSPAVRTEVSEGLHVSCVDSVAEFCI